MWRSNIRSALRNLMRHKGYSTLNILGLAVGLACAFFILLWIRDEVSTDRFHENGDRIYKVLRTSTFGGEQSTTDAMPEPLAQAMLDEYPEVEKTALVSWEIWSLLRLENEAICTNGLWAGPDFFDIFSFKLVMGDPVSALRAPESIVITARLASRFFGTDWRTRSDIIGRQIRVDNRIDLRVTGVAEDPPANSTLDFGFVVPVEELVRRSGRSGVWNDNGLHVWALMRPGTDASAFNDKFRGIIDRHVEAYQSDVFIYPLGRLYLHGDFENGVVVGGRIAYVRSFALVALLVIVIASINFTNLATARSAQRAREIGVRKSAGASRASLFGQFMAESLLKAGAAFIGAVLLVSLLMPMFGTLTGKSTTLDTIDPAMWVLFGGIAMLTGLLAATYPAVHLSGFSVLAAVGMRPTAPGKGATLRKGLVVVQFALSIALMVGTLTVHRQLSFVRTLDVGLDRENVVMVRLEGGMRDQFDAFRDELLKVEGVSAVTTSNNNPLDVGNDTDRVQWEGKDPSDNTLFWHAAVGDDFVRTLGISLARGRAFSDRFGADSANYLVNRKAAEAMGMEDPVGRLITFRGATGTIVGEMEDFHMGSIYQPIRPVILRFRPRETNLMLLRIEAGRTTAALAGLETLYERFNPDYLLNVRFMDEEYEATWRSETVLGKLADVFAMVAMLIACLGLFGLASYTAQQRSREIGIRKVLGASLPSLAAILSREFLVLVTAAFLLAAPVAYLIMQSWLSGFAHRVDIGPGMLAMAFLLSLTIAGLTVSYQSIRCALLDPVRSLKSE